MSTATAASDVLVPDIGDFTDVPIIEILVSPGDTVAAEDPLVTLESDKATMDVPSPMEGVVEEIKVSVGDSVSEGTLLLTLTAPDAAEEEQATESLAEPAAEEPAPDEESSDEPPAAPAVAAEPEASAPPYASPGTRRLARELGVDLAQVTGSGRKGRITGDDVRAFEEASTAASRRRPHQPPRRPAATAGSSCCRGRRSTSPSTARSRSSRCRGSARSRARTSRATGCVSRTSPTTTRPTSPTSRRSGRQLNEEYKKQEVRVTMLAFLIKACVAGLKQFPDFNASLDGDNLIVKNYYNVGFAADTPNGLVVPVVKGADTKGVIEIANEMGELSLAARAGKLKPGDMAGGNFTISSLGGIGGTSFTPIVNAPEVAILGVVRSAMKPVWDGSEFVPRLMLPLSLSYDHRVIDGAAAARFVKYLVTILEDMRRVLL